MKLLDIICLILYIIFWIRFSISLIDVHAYDILLINIVTGIFIVGCLINIDATVEFFSKELV